MSEVTELKAAVEQAAGPASDEVKSVIDTAVSTAWAKYKKYVYIGAAVLLVIVGVILVKAL